MNNIRTFLFVATIIFSLSTWAQVPVMPDQFRIQLPNSNAGSESPISWFELDYKYPLIDLRGLQHMTSYRIPDSVLISPPDLSGFFHMAALVGITGKADDPTVIIWLAGNYQTNRFTLFIDQDQDRDFTNDRSPIRIRRGGAPIQIHLSTHDGDQYLDLTPPPRLRENRPLRDISDGFSLSFSAGIGVGDISYTYQDLTYNQPSQYGVKLVEKGIKATAAYEWAGIQLGGSLAVQNHFFYTSTLEIKKGDPIRLEVPDPNFPGRTTFITIENIEKLNNKDIHSPNRWQASLYGAYSFKLGSTFALQPMFTAGMVSHFDPQYTRLMDEAGETYDLKPYSFYELGLRLEFTVGVRKSIFLEFVRATENWQPENFLAPVPHDDLEADFTLWRFNLGYRFGTF